MILSHKETWLFQVFQAKDSKWQKFVGIALVASFKSRLFFVISIVKEVTPPTTLLGLLYPFYAGYFAKRFFQVQWQLSSANRKATMQFTNTKALRFFVISSQIYFKWFIRAIQAYVSIFFLNPVYSLDVPSLQNVAM